MQIHRILNVSGHGKIVQIMSRGFFGGFKWTDKENLSLEVKRLEAEEKTLKEQLKGVTGALKIAREREKSQEKLITAQYKAWLQTTEGQKYAKSASFISEDINLMAVPEEKSKEESQPKDNCVHLVSVGGSREPAKQNNNNNNNRNQQKKGGGNNNNQGNN